MRTFRLTAVAAVAAFALSMPAFAAQAKPAAKPAAKAAKTMTVRGTLQKVEGQDLTIQTAKGSEEVMFGNDVKIRRGGKALATSDLSAAAGSRITVRYKQDNGHKMAESVTLAAAKSAAPKQEASAKPAASAKGTKK
jgi:FtsP/CotA-like multicopper oxidase with cupredoxin domain